MRPSYSRAPRCLEAALQDVMDELSRLIAVIDEAPGDAVVRGARTLNRAALDLALAARVKDRAISRFEFARDDDNSLSLAAQIAAGAASLAALVVSRPPRLHS
jgi:hypothetical protein